MRVVFLPTLLAALCLPASSAVTYVTAVDVGSAQTVGANSLAARNNFLSQLVAPESLDLESPALNTLNAVLTGGGATISITSACTNCEATFSGIKNASTNEFGYNTTSLGSKFYQLSAPGTNNAAASVTFTFGTPVRAFGLYITGVQSFLGTVTYSFNNGSPQGGTLPTSAVGSGTPIAGSQFLGILSDTTFSSIVFTTTNGVGIRDIVGFDDFLVASNFAAVPEPSTLATLGLALAALAFKLRRRS